MSQADDPTPLVSVTERARQKILEIRQGEADADRLALWLEVSGQTAADYTYDMYFQPVDDAHPGDAVQGHDDLPVVVLSTSVDKLRGATLDFTGDGMVITNPNRPAPPPRPPAASPPMDRPPADLSGPVAQRVQQVLEQQINPSIAAHGGWAELVSVEDDNTAILRLGGGCQGCGMAAATLSQGIEVAIKEAVPEIERVLDVTDHASGENPYYEAAKK
jgi:Fe/S biogenesis protein NfuA